jgi:hypothetical protein
LLVPLTPSPAPACPAAQLVSASPRREAARGKASGGFGGFALERQRCASPDNPGAATDDVEISSAHGEKPLLKGSHGFYAEMGKSQLIAQAIRGARLPRVGPILKLNHDGGLVL